MSLTRRGNKRKTNFQSHGPFSGGGSSLGLGDIARLSSQSKSFRFKQEQAEIQADRDLKVKEQSEKDAASAAFAASHKGCFKNSKGEEICDAGKGKLFVSPEQFAKNIDKGIRDDLPKLALAVSLAGAAGVEIPLVLVLAAAATKGIGLESSGFGKGNRRRNV